MDRWRNEWGGRKGGGGCYLPSNLLLPFKSNQVLPFCGAPLHSSLGWFSPPCPPHWAHHTNSVTCCSPLFWSQPHLCRVSIGTGISNKGWLWLQLLLVLTALYNPISLMSFHPCALLCITFTFVLQIRKLRLRAAAQRPTDDYWQGLDLNPCLSPKPMFHGICLLFIRLTHRPAISFCQMNET